LLVIRQTAGVELPRETLFQHRHGFARSAMDRFRATTFARPQIGPSPSQAPYVQPGDRKWAVAAFAATRAAHYRCARPRRHVAKTVVQDREQFTIEPRDRLPRTGLCHSAETDVSANSLAHPFAHSR
jgi:hypothetical protein